MTVSVEVIGRTVLTVDRQPATLEITRDDVSRGYIELHQAVSFRVRSNAANGYTLQFEAITFPFSRAEVTWDESAATVTGDGSWMFRPYLEGTTAGTLNVRLTLMQGTQPGIYAWPVRFAAGS